MLVCRPGVQGQGDAVSWKTLAEELAAHLQGDSGWTYEAILGEITQIVRLALDKEPEKLGRGGEPGCLHEIVRRTESGSYRCMFENCGEGFMSRNDAQVFVLKEVSTLEADLGAQQVELDDLRRKMRDAESELEHLQAVGGKAHEKGGNPGCWACRLFTEVGELKAGSALFEKMLKEYGFGGEPVLAVRDVLHELKMQKVRIEKLREVLQYVFDCIEPIAHTGRLSEGGEQRGNSMHVEWAFAKVKEALK